MFWCLESGRTSEDERDVSEKKWWDAVGVFDRVFDAVVIENLIKSLTLEN